MDYDAFGRAGTVKGPDNKDTTFLYKGVQTVERTVGVAMVAGAADTPVTTKETYDAHGRLIEVEEASGTQTNPSDLRSANVKTKYQYDVANHLKKVETTDETVAAHPQQLRTFTYDLRGLLTEEYNPEKGYTYFRAYDARGHLLRRQDGTSTKYDLTYVYDDVERMTEIQSTSSGDPIKEF